MRYASIFLITLACRSAPLATTAPDPGDARQLAGTWVLELRNGSWLPFGGASRVFGGRNLLRSGQLRLSPEPVRDSAHLQLPSPPSLRGFFRVEYEDEGGIGHVDLPASASVDAKGWATIAISLDSRCRDCRDLELTGLIEGSTVIGTYTQAIGGPARRLPEGVKSAPPGIARGRFTLRRLTP